MTAAHTLKFADCECSAAEEDWETVNLDRDGGLDAITYRCRTCETLQTVVFEVE